jgi:ferredoxin/flavodoxin---NADP+ reductase
VSDTFSQMNKILRKQKLAPNIFEIVVDAPLVAGSAQPGQFVVVMADQRGERIPLTIADFDSSSGTVTIVLMVVGTSSLKLSRLEKGQSLFALIGPLGHASEIVRHDTVLIVAGGVGTAPVYPIARAFHDAGSPVICIQGARSEDMLFWTDRMAAVSDELIVTTDDGSAGRKALVTEPLRELIQADADRRIECVYAIGPANMMRFCSAATKPFGIRTIVSLNSIMVDGTGMCGGCRVEVGGLTKFTCVDGPEFDGHQVNWDLFLARQRIYHKHEDCSLQRLAQSKQFSSLV